MNLSMQGNSSSNLNAKMKYDMKISLINKTKVNLV